MSKPIYLTIYLHSLCSLVNDISLNSDPNDPDRLYITYDESRPLQESRLDELLAVLKKPQIQIAQLELYVSPDIIKTAKFKELVKKLGANGLHYLKLNFDKSLPKDLVNAALLESGIAKLATYPITLSLPLSSTLDKTFISQNIENIRHYEQQPKSTRTLKETNQDDANLPRIKLKDIICNQGLRNNDNLVSIDVAIEAETEAQVEAEMDVEVAVEAQSTFYTGLRYNYDQFIEQQYRGNNLITSRMRYNTDLQIKLKLIQQELFAQLPCAIQYVTPAAANKIHSDFAQIMSFNKDNLPPGMFLQKTRQGALVLDYELSHERNYNLFTPIDNLRYEEEEREYFDDQLLPDEFHQCESWPFFRENSFSVYKQHFINLYVRYGTEKLRDFVKLFEVDNAEEHIELAQCIKTVFRSYVASYDQCDFMVKDPWFSECIQRIKQETDVTKLTCLTSLLRASRFARHDLQHTLDAFDVFWKEIKSLCPEEKLGKITFAKLKINKMMKMPGIPPVVAMERLLTILQNARDVSSQIDYLNEIPSGAFRAYYASAYEGFGMMHKDMDISWAPNVYTMHHLTEWPSNLTYFKYTFVLLNDELFYITQDLNPEPVRYTDLTIHGQSVFKHGKEILKELKAKKCIQIPREDLFFLTAYHPNSISYNQHAKIYQVDISTLRDMALKEKVIDYRKFYAFLHRYMGQQKTGISYADFRAQTAVCNFQHQDKVVAFTLLFFITDVNYDEQVGITSLITQLNQLEPLVLQQLAETLYKLQGRGIVLNNQEGLIILKKLLTTNPNDVFEELNQRKLIITEYEKLLNKFKTIAPSVKKALKQSRVELNQVPIILNTLQSFSEEHQVELFNALTPELQKNNLEQLCENITQLRVAALPPEYIIHYTHLKELDCDAILERFTHDQHDPILSYILSNNFIGNSADAKKLLDLTATNQNKHKVVALLENNNILHYIADPVVLDILAKSYDTLFAGSLRVEQWQELIQLLSSLENRQALINLYKITAPNSICLFNALKNKRLDLLEREPFGPRDDKQHFHTSQVERVVNESLDWSNNTVYSYKYRKQLMEAFTFVNKIGYKLPIFEGRTAKELSNAEIQAYFQGIKDHSILQDLSSFQQQLIALSLIREALYRSTGQMAYSTQLIAIIDCLMHEGHVISNIDTGQGKSLIDMAKSALLWLNSDRVDSTTSSIADAKRDLENFSPFLHFLNIPHGSQPITTQSELSDFVANGINTSSFAQMSLFEAKMKMTGESLGEETDVVSLIVNESDYSLLEDRTVYRYASQSTENLGPQAEWIYTAVNEFVLSPQFTSRTTSAQRDIANLKSFVTLYAREHNKKSYIVNEISAEQWLKWINAAILVQYKLKENEDFIIPQEQQAVTIRGKKQMSHVVKLLMTEGKVKTKVSDDAKFGNSVHQLLYAQLNKKYPDKQFIIEPETNTILSSNNRNLIDNYLQREKPGIIWGSSGTVGSSHERKELHAKYNIDFSKIAPHQAKIIDLHEAQFFKDRDTQFAAIKNKMAPVKLGNQARPQLIFCKDINSAIKLHALLRETHPDNLQIYTGGNNDEEACVAKAALGGMITICTAAIGRNTDILYNRSIGMNVMHTSINSYNLEAQLTGRTGRQGSVGDIDFYFNKQEIGSKTKEQIQDEIYQNSLKDRAFNEEIYSILANVLAQIEQRESQRNFVNFLTDTWAKLSIRYENLYKELKINDQYKREDFINLIIEELKDYNLDKNEVLSAITHQFKVKKSYDPYAVEVKLKDCIPPVELAYALLNKNKNQSLINDNARNQIKEKVYQLLKNYKNSKKTRYHVDYIRYLSASAATQDEIRAIHQECIKEFLDNQAHNVLPWYRRLFSYKSMLNEVANSANYLILFRSLMSVPSSVQDTTAEANMAKSSVIALVREYQTQWFIHAAHKKIAQQLIQDLEPVDDLTAMVEMLTQYQITLAKKDTEINQTKRWFPLHRSGSSRLQNTLSSALNLTSSLHKTDSNYTELLEELEQTDDHNKTVIKQQISTSITLRESFMLFSNAGQRRTQQDDDLDLDTALQKIS